MKNHLHLSLFSKPNEIPNSQNTLFNFFLSVFFLLATLSASAQTNYYSQATSNLDVLTTWGTNIDGTGTAPLDFTSANQIFNIWNNAAPTIGAPWAVSGPGSKVIVGDGTNSCTFTIPSGILFTSVATDISNSGVLKNQNAAETATSYGSPASAFNILNGGTYQHNCDGGILPTGTWTTGSNCSNTGTIGTVPTNMNQNFYNFLWDCAGQTAFLGSGAFPTGINGTCEFRRAGATNTQQVNWTGGGTYIWAGDLIVSTRFILLTSTTINMNLTLRDLYINANSAGNPRLLTNNSALTANLNIRNLNISGSSLDFNGINTNATNVNISGNFTMSGGAILASSTGTSGTNSIINFNGTTQQDVNITGGTLNGLTGRHIRFLALANSIVNFVTPLAWSTNTFSDFTASANSTLMIPDVNGITAAIATQTGSVRTTSSRTFNTTASYIYTGTSVQITGTGLPATVKDLGLKNAAGITVPGEAVSGILTITNCLATINGNISVAGATNMTGSTVTLSGGNIAANGNVTMAGTLVLPGALRTFTIGGTATLTGAFSATNMFKLDGTTTGGQLIKTYNAGATNFTFPVGTGSVYAGVNLNFAANSAIRNIGIRVINSTHPALGTPPNYIDRYWKFTDGLGTGTYSYSATFNYSGASIIGTESLLRLNRYNGAAWTEDAGSSAAANILTSSSGLDQTTGTLGGNDFTGFNVVAGGGNTITTDPVSGSPFCQGSNVSVSYSSTGIFTGTFMAQLSDAFGAFPGNTTSNIIGSGASPISATIPGGQGAGTGYRIRVVNDIPVTFGLDNGNDLTVSIVPVSCASAPVPSNGATDQSANVTLSWVAVSGATAYDVYFGTSSPVLVSSNQPGITYNTGALLTGTTYQWYIIPKNLCGSNNSCSATIWSFTTGFPLYRTVSTGNWNDQNIWEYSSDGGANYLPAIVSPDYLNSSGILVRNGNVVAVTANVTVDQVTFDNTINSTIILNAGVTLTVNDGTGNDIDFSTNGNARLLVNGTVTAIGQITGSTASITSFNSGSTYIHQQNAGAIPLATWNTGSDCNITGILGTPPSNMSQNFYNFLWDNPSQSGVINFGSANFPTGINGTFEFRRIGSTTQCNLDCGNRTWAGDLVVSANKVLIMTSAGGTFSITLRDLYLNNNYGSLSRLLMNNSANTFTFNIRHLIINGGILDYNGINTNNTNVNMSGNLTMTGGTIYNSNNLTAGTSNFNFSGTTQQDINISGSVLISGLVACCLGNPNRFLSFNANANSIVKFVTPFKCGAGVNVTFTAASGSTLIMPDPNGITAGAGATTGDVQVPGTGGSSSFSTGANYIYNGSVSQITGTALPATVNNLTINNSSGSISGVTLTNTITVNGILALTDGRLTLGTKNITLPSAASLSGTPSITNMVIADGSGQFIRGIAAGTPSITLPVGDATPNYTPVSLNFSANSVPGTIGVRVTNSTEPNNNTPNSPSAYLSRYWTFTNTSLTNYSYTGTFTYPSANINGIESNLKLSRWTGSAWFEHAGSSASSNLLSITSALDQSTAPLTGDFTGRSEACIAPTVEANANGFPVSNTFCSGIPLLLSANITTTGGGCTGNEEYSWHSSSNNQYWDGSGFNSATQLFNVSYNTVNITAISSSIYSLEERCSGNISCSSNTSTVTVTVNPNPVLSIGTQTNVSCNGLSDGSVDLDASSGTAPFLFDLVGPSTPDGIFTGLPAGTYTATVNDDNGCAATSLTVTITEPDVLTVSAGSNTPVCSGTSLSLNATPTGGTSGYSYAWTGPNGPIPSVQNPIIASVTASDAGNYSVQVTDANSCTATSANHLVQVNTSPTAAIALVGSPDKCLGQSATISLTFTGTGPWNYTITGNGGPYSGSTSSNQASVNVTPIAAGVHNYTVTSIGNASCPTGGTTSGSATVNVSTAPPPSSGPVPAGAAEACAGSVMLITSNVISGQNIIYSWNTGSNSSTVLFSTNIGGPFTAGPFQTNTNQVYAQFGALGGGQSGYQVCLQGVNGCGSSINKCLWIRGVVSGPGAIIPANGVVACPNDVKSYICGASGGASVYNWTLSGSSTAITSGQGTTNVQVTFPAAFTSGQLCVTAALSCAGSSTSPARCMTINKNPANPTVPAGAATVCPGATGVSYSIGAVPGATGYNWTVPANATIATGANSPSITVDFPTPYNGSSSVCVTTTSACSAGAVKCKTVASGVPNQPAGITGPLTNVCGSTVQYSIVNPIASSYTWTNPAGTTISGSATGSTILLNVSPAFTSGFLTVAANSVLCAPVTSAPRTSGTIWGRPNTPGAITANPVVWCSGGGVNFSITPAAPLPTYTWTVSNGTVDAGQGSNNIDVTWGANASGTITVRASNGCGLSAGTSSQSFTSGCREESREPAAAAFSVYPNPAHDKITVSIDVKEQTQFNVKLLDMSGRVIFSEDHAATAGINAYELDLKDYAKWIYMLEVQSADDKWKTKVIIE